MPGIDECLLEAMTLPGARGAALVDWTSGLALGTIGDSPSGDHETTGAEAAELALGTIGGGKDLDLTVAAAGNTDVVRAKVRTMEMLGLKDEIENILITLGAQYHLIRLLKGRGASGLFLYLALDKDRANLAMARHQLKRIEAELKI